MNESKAKLNSPMWAKWRASGAVGNMESAHQATLYASPLIEAESRPGREPQVFHVGGVDITVQELREEDGDLLAAAADGKWVRLGAQTPDERQLEMQVNAFLRLTRENATEVYLLSWEGNKIPRGAEINGQVIAWTQSGMVTSTAGQEMGTYERLVEFGGENQRTQQMVVFALPS